MRPQPPVIRVVYRHGGHADVIATWLEHQARAEGAWSTGHAVWMPGRYDRSHRVGLHGGRPAVVQQGVTALEVCDHSHHGGELARANVATRKGWRGWNIHDLRGALEGCVGLDAAAMLDVLGVCERAREAGAEQHPEGGVYVTLIVEHAP